MRINEVFVDTSGWANAFVKTEPHHITASTSLTQRKQHNRRVVTTNYVLSELVPLFVRMGVPRKSGLNYIDVLRTSDWVEIVHVDEKAWQLLANRLDKEWSLVDAVSFVVMQEREMTDALTADHHFEQAGFQRLLK